MAEDEAGKLPEKAARPQREERMRADVERLATPAGRMVGTPGHRRAQRLLAARMAAVGLEPYVGDAFAVTYEAAGQRFANLLGVVPGVRGSAAAPPLVLAAHHDTCGPLPGADDNAAAIAILLEAVGLLREHRLPRPLLVAFFDAEEPPHFLGPEMGSVRFYREQRRGPVHGAVVLDLCGHDVPVPGAEDVLFVTGMESDADLGAVVTEAAAAAGQRVVPVLNRTIGDLSDHHAFRLDRRPYLFLSCAHWEHYHAATDTADRLSYSKMARLVDFVVEVAAQAARAPLAGPFEGWDTTAIELRCMREAFASLLEPLGIGLRGRADLDRAAAVLMARFGL